MRYYSINATVNPPTIDIIVTARGNENNKTVNVPQSAPHFPPVKIGADPQGHQSSLGNVFGNWAITQGQGHTIICEVDNSGNVKAWVVQGQA